METFYIKGSCRNEWISNIWDIYPISITTVSMQRLSATITVAPKGRIINSCTVDCRTVFMLIMETQVSKLTLSHTPEQNGPSGTEQSGVVPIPNPWACESHKWPPQGQTLELATSQGWTPNLQAATITVTPKGRIINSCTVDYQTVYMLIMETQVSKLTTLWLN